MIVFERLIYKNILSTGNQPIEINFQENKRTLIIGTNGNGKSTILDALCFGLFGLPFKNINKPTLINSINKKNLLVEVFFKVNGRPYHIKRGMKPNVFEIYEDNVLLNQTAKAKDYQEYIETNVLKLNFNAFKQIVIIGKGDFVPFMKLKAGERREIIENLLDLSVFSVMNSILKEKINENKNNLQELEFELSNASYGMEAEKQKLQFARDTAKKQQEDNEEKKIAINQQIDSYEDKKNKISQALEKFKGIEEIHQKAIDKKGKIASKISVDKNMMSQTQKQIDFFSNHDECPTCKQEIDVGFKSKLLEESNLSREAFISVIEQEEKRLSEIQTILAKFDAKIRKKNELLNAVHSCQLKIDMLRKNIEDFQVSVVSIDEDSIVSEIKQLSSKKDDLLEKKKQLLKDQETMKFSALLLKDSGIKAKIISTYIPLINKFINKYLDIMNFYVQFEIDENFNETIKSRYRDSFSYTNFSEGEKERIDLALLFTWREIARIKNSMNVNLLFLDEAFDSSLDFDGTEDLLKILKSLDDTNVFVISHKIDALSDRFPVILKFEKKSNFSTVTKVI